MGTIMPFKGEEFELDLNWDTEGDTFKVYAPGLSRSLGFAEARDLVRAIPDDEKGSELAPTPGGDQRAWYVTEAGFYRAIGQRQPDRIKDEEIRDKVVHFQNWVYHEVLPQIRRTGTYAVPAVPAHDLMPCHLIPVQHASPPQEFRRLLEAITRLSDHLHEQDQFLQHLGADRRVPGDGVTELTNVLGELYGQVQIYRARVTALAVHCCGMSYFR